MLQVALDKAVIFSVLIVFQFYTVIYIYINSLLFLELLITTFGSR